MYKVSVDNNTVVNFSHELNVIGEMIHFVYNSFLNFAKRLCSLEHRMSNFQAQEGYRWIEVKARKSVASDFYSYLKVNQRHISAELNELNAEFEQCKKQAEFLILKIGECETLVFNISAAPLLNHDNLIPFKPNAQKDYDVVKELSRLLAESEKLSQDIRLKHQSVSRSAANLVMQMRGQLQE